LVGTFRGDGRWPVAASHHEGTMTKTGSPKPACPLLRLCSSPLCPVDSDQQLIHASPTPLRLTGQFLHQWAESTTLSLHCSSIRIRQTLPRHERSRLPRTAESVWLDLSGLATCPILLLMGRVDTFAGCASRCGLEKALSHHRGCATSVVRSAMQAEVGLCWSRAFQASDGALTSRRSDLLSQLNSKAAMTDTRAGPDRSGHAS